MSACHRTNLCALFQSSALAIAFVLGGEARAQDADRQVSGSTIERVVVTAGRYAATHASSATKTDTPILETPMSVEVVTRQMLEDQQVISIDQALRNVSGITEGGGGANDNGQKFSAVRIRGFASDAFLVDGTRLYSFASDSDLYTQQFAGIDSVEVLKGPAAILYGALEPGGIVNVVSRQPEPEPGYEAQQQLGSYDLYRTSFDATGPATGHGALLYRLDASVENDGSPIRYLYDNSVFVAPTLRWDIDPDTRATIEFKYRYVDFGQNYGTVPLYNGVPVNGPDVNYGARSPERETTYFGAITVSHDFGDGLSVRQRIVYNAVGSNGAGILPAEITTGLATPSGVGLGRWINHVVNSDSNFNTITDFVKKLTLFGIDDTILFGGDYARFAQSGHIDQAGEIDSNVSYVDFFDPNFVLNPFHCCTTPLIIDSAWTETAGAYLQDEASLPFRLHLLAGLRWQYMRQGSAFDFPAFALSGIPPVLTASAVTPRAGILWQATDWLNPYASYVESFGPSASGYTLANGQQPPPSRGNQWEIGAKAGLLGGRLIATLDYYDLVKTNIPTPDIFNTGFVTVIGEAESKGIELDVSGEVANGWNIVLSYAHDDAVATKSSPLAASPVGSHFGGVPENQAHLWTTYELQAPALTGWKIGGGVTYADASSATPIARGPAVLVPGYTTFDLMTSYDFRALGANWTARLNATNIFDRIYVTDSQTYAFPSVGPYSLVTNLYGDRRTVVGSLRVAF